MLNTKKQKYMLPIVQTELAKLIKNMNKWFSGDLSRCTIQSKFLETNRFETILHQTDVLNMVNIWKKLENVHLVV